MPKTRIILLILAVFAATRIGVILTNLNNVYTCEELHQGVVAKDIMEGADLALMEYPPNAYNGGTFIVGLVTIPFFALLGQNLFALKMTPVLFSTLTLLFLLIFCWRFFNRRAALIMSGLYIFSGHIWVSFNVYNAGFHSESLVFTAASMLLLYEIVFNNRKTWPWHLGLGLVCGFGSYFSPTFLITLVALLIVWLIHQKGLFKSKMFYIFLAGFLSGMIPYFIYNLGSGFKGLSDVFPVFLQTNDYATLSCLPRIFLAFIRLMWFPLLLGYAGMGKGFYIISGFIYNGLFWSSILYLILKNKKDSGWLGILRCREFFIILFPFILILVASLYGVEPGGSGFMDWKYFMVIIPFIYLAAAIFLSMILEKRRALWRSVWAIFYILVFVVSLAQFLKINWKDFGRAFKEIGYNYSFLFESFNCKYPRNLYKILDNITRLSKPERYEVLYQPLTILLSEPLADVEFAKYLDLTRRIDEEYKPFFYKILVKGLYFNSGLSLTELIAAVRELSQEVKEEYRPYFYEAIGCLMVKRFPEDTAQYRDAALLIDKKFQSYYYRGLSEPVYMDYIGDYLKRAGLCLAWLPDESKPFYLGGLGEIMAKTGVSYIMEGLSPEDEESVMFYDFFNDFERPLKKYLLEGVGRGLAYFYTVNTEKDIRTFINNFSLSDRAQIEKALIANSKGKYEYLKK